MEFDYNSIKLDRDDLNGLHDTIGEALDNWELTDEQLIEYWKKLPNNIKADAMKWGVSDTPTRDSIYVWVRDNCAQRLV